VNFLLPAVFTPGTRGRLAVLAALTLLLAGCGTSEYRQLMGKRVDQVRTGAAFRTLFGPTTIPDTPIRIRVPMVYQKSYSEDSKHARDGERINPDRFQPPFVKIPGMKLCYEGTGTDPQFGPIGFYCYLAAVPARPGDADKIAAEIQAELKQKLKETPDQWSSLDATTPDGKALQWKRIRVECDQPFFVLGMDGKTESKDVPAIFELWMYAAPDYVVFVGWRSPKSVDGPSSTPPADSVLPTTTGKSDLSTMPVLAAGTLTIEGDANAAQAPAEPAN
jgi:hypothetical protein